MKSHLRTEKNCLNCGAYVVERYCTHCGQENTETRESFSHLVSHFFSDLTHYDSKLFITLKDLLFRPGFLTREYLDGKRTSYLHPIRMYVFVSFLYFLVTLSFNDLEHRTKEYIAETAAENTRRQIVDSVKSVEVVHGGNSINNQIKDSVVRKILAKIDTDSPTLRNPTILFNLTYRDLVIYDSTQRLLPEAQREKGWRPWLYQHWLNTIDFYGKKGFIVRAADRTVHFVPKLMFVLLPLFALLLKLFYSKRKYYYADHIIFSLHFHTAAFLIFLTFSIVGLLLPVFARDATSLQYLLAFIYLGIALRTTYHQSVLVTGIKLLSITLLYAVFILAGYVILVVSSIM